MSEAKAQQRFEAECPECHTQCGWCSMYRWIVRKEGCMAQFKKTRGQCQLAKAEKGKSCTTCGGSRRVMVTQTLEPSGASR